MRITADDTVLEHVMTLKKLTGVLLKPIHIDDAKARGLRASLGLDPDESDILAHIEEQRRARWAQFDEFLGLKSNGNTRHVWQRRTKALVAHKFSVEPRGPHWWERSANALAPHYFPGFSIKGSGKKKHGAPREWSDERLCQLFADVEFLKKKTGMSVRKICKVLPRRRGYEKRWGADTSEALRKAYTKANRQRRTLLFQFKLCGAKATIPGNRIDHITAAIRQHALKI